MTKVSKILGALKRAASWSGFGTEKQAIITTYSYFFPPHLPMHELRPRSSDLVSIPTLFLRFLLCVRLSLLFLPPRHFDNGKLVLFIFFFVIAKQISFISYWVSSLLINLLIRVVFRRNDFIAAGKAYVFSNLAPSSICFALAFEPVLKELVQFYPLMVMVYLATALAASYLAAKEYGLPFWKTGPVIIFAALLLFSIVPTMYLPFYLSVKLSPEIVKKDIDLGILALDKFPTDSCCDGSFFLSQLPEFPKEITDSLELLYRNRKWTKPVTNPHIKQISDSFLQFPRITYFDKQHLQRMQIDTGWQDSNIVDLKYTTKTYPYLKAAVLQISFLMKNGRYDEANKLVEKTLMLCQAFGESDMGLVPSVVSVAFSRFVFEIISANLTSISDKRALSTLSEILGKYQIKREWVMNALRLEHRHLRSVLEKPIPEFYEKMRNEADSLGYWAPEFTMKKWLDIEDSKQIHDYTWARMLVEGVMRRKSTRDFHIYEVDEINKLTTSGRRGKLKLLIGKNTFGRILAISSTGVYLNYVRRGEDCSRFQSFLLCALAIQKDCLSQTNTPPGVNVKSFTMAKSSIPYSFSFHYDPENMVFTSTDSVAETDTFRVVFKKPAL